MQGCSSSGRANDSKSLGRGFESLRPCQFSKRGNMEKTTSKILTVSFVTTAFLVGLTTSLLIKAFAGAFGVVARLADSDMVRHVFPVVLGLAVFFVLQFNPRVLAWGQEVVTEVRKVVWPSRKDTTAMTIACVIMVLISSVIVSAFDLISGFFINFLMK